MTIYYYIWVQPRSVITYKSRSRNKIYNLRLYILTPEPQGAILLDY